MFSIGFANQNDKYSTHQSYGVRVQLVACQLLHLVERPGSNHLDFGGWNQRLGPSGLWRRVQRPRFGLFNQAPFILCQYMVDLVVQIPHLILVVRYCRKSRFQISITFISQRKRRTNRRVLLVFQQNFMQLDSAISKSKGVPKRPGLRRVGGSDLHL